MKDMLYFIYFSIMGIIGLVCYCFLMLFLILYYPIWSAKKGCNKKNIEPNYKNYFIW